MSEIVLSSRLNFSNPWLGVPVFFTVMYCLFAGCMALSGCVQDYLNDGIEQLFNLLGLSDSAAWIIGLKIGLQTLASFIPVLGSIYFALGFLEKSGFIARVVLSMDKFMHRFGLSGQSLIPMVLGFGCNVPAVLAAKQISNKKQQIMITMMSPFMSCGARLAIYAVFVSVFFPDSQAFIILALYIVGIIVALLTAFFLKSALAETTVLESCQQLPPYQWPKLKPLLKQSIRKVWHFLKHASRWLIPMCIGFRVLVSIDWSSTVFEPSWLTAWFAPMGITVDNWPAVVGLFSGIIAKEGVVSTLNALYGLEPGNLYAYFGSQAAAFSYLLFVLLYFPCISVLVAIKQALSLRWALLSVLWTTLLAYTVSVLFYQLATLCTHPMTSVLWILGGGLCVAGFVMLLKRYLMGYWARQAQLLPIRIIH